MYLDASVISSWRINAYLNRVAMMAILAQLVRGSDNAGRETLRVSCADTVLEEAIALMFKRAYDQRCATHCCIK